jgi:hypothetical protein
MKTISLFLALINSLFAGFLIALDLSYHGFLQGLWWWSLLKLSIAAWIIVIGVSTWLGEMGILSPGAVMLGGLCLIALGPATIVWAIHVALTTGVIEYHMVIYAMSLLVQGMASLLGMAGETRNVPAS